MLIDEDNRASALMMSPMAAGRNVNERNKCRSKELPPRQLYLSQRLNLDHLSNIFIKSTSSSASSRGSTSSASEAGDLVDLPSDIYCTKSGHRATNGNELSVFRGERVQTKSLTGEWVKAREMARGEEGRWIPSEVLTLSSPKAAGRAAPSFACNTKEQAEKSALLSGFTNVEPMMRDGSVGAAKKTVRFKEEEPEILTDASSVALSKSPSVSSLDDLPAIQIASGRLTPPSIQQSDGCGRREEDKQMLRVYAGNFDPEGGYRTIMADESATLSQIAEQARLKFRHLASEATGTRCYISIVHIDTGHALFLPSPHSTLDLGTAIELAKKATLMQSPMPAKKTKSIRRLARRLAKLHGGGKQPEWIQPATDDRAIEAESAGLLEDVCLTGGINVVPMIGLLRDKSTDFVTRYRFVLNVR